MSKSHHRASITWAPGAGALLGSSVLARLPLAMFSIALLVHAQRLTGSFAVAGLASGGYAISAAVSSPVLGRLVDRWGQTRVLVSGATTTALVLVIIGLLPATPSPVLLIALACAAGLAIPPLAACVRTILPAAVSSSDDLPALFAFESTILELTFVLGPPLALGLGVVWSTGAALVLTGAVMLISTLVFAAQPASRGWRGDPTARRPRGGSLQAPAVRTLVLVLLGTGAVFGATDVGVTAATKVLHSAATAGPLLGLWGAGSLLGGAVATRLGGSAGTPRGLIRLLGALALGHGALMFATRSVPAIAVLIVLAGATIAPSAASIYAMVGRAAPAGTQTEAFSWVTTASLSGAAAGAAAAGALVESAGPAAAFAFAAVAGALAVLVAVLGSGDLDDVCELPTAAPAAAAA